METETHWREKKTWTTKTELGLVEVCLHNMDNPYIRGGDGIYNYYLYIYERECPKAFKEFWLEDIPRSLGEGCSTWISHEYYHLDMFDFHGGITYYSKHGHTEGFRSVQIGCDFNHLWDENKVYILQDIQREAMRSMELLINYLKACEK